MWEKIKAWFHRSETIAWARAQVVVGAVWTVLSSTDLSPLLNPKWLTWWLIASGAITEYLRRRGTAIVNGALVDTPPPPAPPPAGK